MRNLLRDFGVEVCYFILNLAKAEQALEVASKRIRLTSWENAMKSFLVSICLLIMISCSQSAPQPVARQYRIKLTRRFFIGESVDLSTDCRQVMRVTGGGAEAKNGKLVTNFRGTIHVLAVSPVSGLPTIYDCRVEKLTDGRRDVLPQGTLIRTRQVNRRIACSVNDVMLSDDDLAILELALSAVTPVEDELPGFDDLAFGTPLLREPGESWSVTQEAATSAIRQASPAAVIVCTADVNAAGLLLSADTHDHTLFVHGDVEASHLRTNRAVDGSISYSKSWLLPIDVNQLPIHVSEHILTRIVAESPNVGSEDVISTVKQDCESTISERASDP